MKKCFLGITIVLMSLSASAQKKGKTLFKIDGERTYVSEFKKLFKPSESALEKNKFQDDLQLMVDYKLKLKQVKLEGIDTMPSIKQELFKYKKDLAAPFLTDDATLQDLLQEAYQRTIYKVKASHILIACKENDTLKAYNTIKELQAKIKKGANFGDLAVKYSDDRSALKNRGELGYFTAFRMVYPFESAAYKTPVGQVSKITKSKFGYHLIKVEDIAKSEGKVKVAHIMIVGLGASKKARIDSVYQKLEAGEDYAKLVKKYSEDEASSNRGGELSAFEKGRLPKEFEDVAFAMSEPNSYSKPFKSPYGWHIIKFIELQTVPPYKELKEDLKNKILKDQRGKKPKEVAFAKMEAKNKIKVNKNATKVFESKNSYTIATDSLQKVLFTINKEPYLQLGFAEFIKSKRRSEKPLEYLEAYKKEKLKAYVIDHLENENEKYKAIIDSYQKGLDIFELMKQHVWDVPAKKQKLVEAYYQEHIENYKDKGDTFKAVKGYVESDFQEKIQQEWIENLRKESKIKFYKRQLKKLAKLYHN